jgi:hypothetical protein
MPKHYVQCLLLTALFAEATLFTGCSTTKVITLNDCADAVNLRKDTIVYHYFWGLKQVADIKPGCDERFNHLNGVSVKTTPGNILLSVITLGIVVPQKFSWCCAPYNPSPGSLGTKK